MGRLDTLASRFLSLVVVAAALLHPGCASPDAVIAIDRPNVVPLPSDQTLPSLTLDATTISPMFTALLPVDAATVAALAVAGNLDIRQAREAVIESEGDVESTIGAAFPAIVPTALFEHVEGAVRASEGDIIGVRFDTFSPSIAVQWVLNPGRILANIAAAKKRLSASEFTEAAVSAETLRRAIVGFYALVLAQAEVGAAHQGKIEAEELVRITKFQTQVGVGVLADELRAVARLAERRQDVVLALVAFYEASVALGDTLNMDPGVTLVPSMAELPPTHFVRSDLTIEELMGFALAFRPDLASVRDLIEAAVADKDAAWWGQYGPEFAISYQYGGVMGNAGNVEPSRAFPPNLIVNPASANGSFTGNPVADGLIREGVLWGSQRADDRSDQSYGMNDQQRITAGVGWRLSLSAFGELKMAGARERRAAISGEQAVARVKQDVVRAVKASEAHRELIGLTRQQVDAAVEALRLTEANLSAGTMTTLDVLQSQDAATQARLRYAGAVVRYNQSQVNLLAAIGLIDSETVEAILTGGTGQGIDHDHSASVEEDPRGNG